MLMGGSSISWHVIGTGRQVRSALRGGCGTPGGWGGVLGTLLGPEGSAARLRVVGFP